MIDIKYTHFEGFGGAIFNNFIGYVSNSFTNITGGFLTNPGAAVGGAIIIGLLLYLYSALKGDLESANKILLGSGGFDNLLVRALGVYLAFFVILMPIPVAQMTPIVIYENTESSAGVNRGDRAIAGWLINDFKTTTNMSTPTGSENEEVLSVPLIFAPLGWIQGWYYGFPEFEAEDIFEEEDASIKFSYKAPTFGSGFPTLRSCVIEEKLVGLEGDFKARIDLGELDSLDSSCKDNLVPGGEWRASVDDSIMVLLFGHQAPSEILSDYFEPIDRIFYYLSASPISSVVQDFLKIREPGEKSKAFEDGLKAFWEINEAAFWADAEERLYEKDLAIESDLLAVVDSLTEIVSIRPEKAFPKEIAQAILQVVLDNEPIKSAWRRNHASDNPAALEIERVAIPQINIGGATGLVAKIKDAELLVLKKLTSEGVHKILPRHLTAIDDILTDDNSLKMIEKIYDDAQATLGIKLPPNAGSYFLTKQSTGSSSASTSMTQEQYIDALGDSYFQASNAAAFEAPATIQTATVIKTDGTSFSTATYKDIYTKIWSVERTLKSRDLMIAYTAYLKGYVGSLLANIKKVSESCDDPASTGLTCESKFKESSPLSITWDESVVVDNKKLVNMVYAGVYPSVIYLSASTEEKQPGDKTGTVLFLPVEDVFEKMGDDVSIDLEGHQKPLKRLSDFLPSNMWDLNSNELKNHFDAKSDFYDEVSSVIGKSLFTSFYNSNPTELKGDVVLVAGTGIDVDYKAMNERSPGLGDRVEALLSTHLKTKSVSFENTSPDYSKLKDFVGRTMPSKTHSSPLDIINPTINSYTIHFSSYISSLDSQINFSKSFYSLVDSMYSFTDPDTGFFKPEYATSLGALFSSQPEYMTTNFEAVLMEYIVKTAEGYESSLATYVKSIADSNKVVEVPPQGLNKEQYIAKMYADSAAASQTSGDLFARYEAAFVLMGCTYDASLSSTTIGAAVANCTEKLANDHASLTIKKPATMNSGYTPLSFPSSSSDGHGLVTAMTRLVWSLVSYPLDFFREFQNTALVKVQEIQSHLGSAYRAPLFFGAIPSDVDRDGMVALNVVGKDKTFVNPDFIPPDLPTAFQGFTKLHFLTDNWADMAFTAVLMLVFGVFAAVMFITVLFFLAVKQFYYILKFLLLAVVSGLYGFFKASVLFPISFTLWLLTYDFSNKESYSSVRHLVGEGSNFNPKQQFIHAWKLLSIWILGFSMMIIILQIDSIFIEPLMQQLVMSNWVQSQTGDTFFWIGTTILIMVLVYIYILILMAGYKWLTEYLIKSYSEDNSDVRLMLSAYKKMSGVQDKLKKLMPGKK